MIFRILPSVMAALLLAACATTAPPPAAQPESTPVTPDMGRIIGPGFSAPPPQGAGWLRLPINRPGHANPGHETAFVKNLGTYSTALAQIGGIAIPQTIGDPDAVLDAFVKSRETEESAQDAGRIRVLFSNSSPVSQSGAHCRRIDRTAEDRGVPQHKGEVFTLTRHILVCLHPDFPAYLVFADYSARVAPGDPRPNADDEAAGEAFLKGLQLDPLGKHVTTIPVGEKVQGLAETPGSLWVAYGRDPGMVARIDTRSNRIVARIAVGKWPVGAAAGGGGIWIVNNEDDTVSRIDPESNKAVATIPVGRKPLEIAAGPDSAWVTDSADNAVSRIDYATNQVTMIRGIGSQPSGIAFGRGTALVVDYMNDKLVQIDPQVNEITARLAAAPESNFILPSGDQAWVNDQHDRAVVRVDLTQQNRVPVKIATGVGEKPTGLALDGNTLWVANWGDDTLTAIDLSGAEPSARVLPAGSHPLIILPDNGTLWVSNAFDGTVLRLDP